MEDRHVTTTSRRQVAYTVFVRWLRMAANGLSENDPATPRARPARNDCVRSKTITHYNAFPRVHKKPCMYLYKKPCTSSQITPHQFTRNPAPDSQGGDVSFWLTSFPGCQPKGYIILANHPLTLVALLRTPRFCASNGKQAILGLTQHDECKHSSHLCRSTTPIFAESGPIVFRNCSRPSDTAS